MNIVSTILHKESEEAKQQMRETQESVGGMISLYLIYIDSKVLMYLQQSLLAKETFWILELSVDKPSVADKAITTTDEANVSGNKMEEKENGRHKEIIIYRVLF